MAFSVPPELPVGGAFQYRLGAVPPELLVGAIPAESGDQMAPESISNVESFPE